MGFWGYFLLLISSIYKIIYSKVGVLAKRLFGNFLSSGFGAVKLDKLLSAHKKLNVVLYHGKK